MYKAGMYLSTVNSIVTRDARDVVERQTWRPCQPTRVAKRRDMSPKVRPSRGDTVGAGVSHALQDAAQSFDARVVRLLRVCLRIRSHRVDHDVADHVRQRRRTMLPVLGARSRRVR